MESLIFTALLAGLKLLLKEFIIEIVRYDPFGDLFTVAPKDSDTRMQLELINPPVLSSTEDYAS